LVAVMDSHSNCRVHKLH